MCICARRARVALERLKCEFAVDLVEDPAAEVTLHELTRRLHNRGRQRYDCERCAESREPLAP